MTTAVPRTAPGKKVFYLTRECHNWVLNLFIMTVGPKICSG